MSNPRSAYMGSRQYPPPPTVRAHVIARAHYPTVTGPCWIRCTCGRLIRAMSPEAICSRWADHRAEARRS